MSRTSRAACLLAGLALTAGAPVPAAAAASGGTTAVSAPASSTADAILTRTVDLTRAQTRSVQRRVGAKADSRIGSRTRSKIRAYQRRHDLTVTGRPNVETLREMGLKLADKLESRMRAQAARADVTVDGSPLLAAAKRAIGTPYSYGGTSLSGFDCSGFVSWAFDQVGRDLPRTSFSMWELGDRIRIADVQPGDLVFFDSAGPGASHVGIATSSTTVISATSSRGVIEHDFDSGYWRRAYYGVKRLS